MNLTDSKPAEYAAWPPWVRDYYNERLAFMAEANKIPPDAQMPEDAREVWWEASGMMCPVKTGQQVGYKVGGRIYER